MQEDDTRILVQFGTDGPRAWLERSSTRPATHSEIAEKLGCHPVHLPEYVKKAHPQ